MGACCSGKDNKKGENQEEEIYTKTSRINSFCDNILNAIKPTIDLEIETSSMSKNLSCIIKKIINDECFPEDIKVQKFTMEYLWNVSRFYLEDHIDSYYLIYDYRENPLRTQNFLKKFKYINYNIEQLRNFSHSQFQRFKRFIKEKNIIIIAKEDSIITIEEFIYYIIENKINVKIYFLDYNLAAINSLSELNKNLLKVMDYSNFNRLPFIFISLRFFPHLKSESLVFLQFIDTDKIQQNKKGCSNKIGNNNHNEHDHNLQNYSLICDKKYIHSDFHDSQILSFFKFFQISVNLKLNIFNDDQPNSNRMGNTNNNLSRKYHSISTMSTRDIKNNKSNYEKKDNANLSNYNYIIKCLEINDIVDLDDLVNKKEIVIDYIDMIKQEVVFKKSPIIQIPLDIDKEALIAILLYFIWKITDIEPINLIAYLKENLFYFPALNNLKEENFEKIFKFLEKNFGMENTVDKNIINRTTKAFYQSVKSKSFKSNNNIRTYHTSANVSGKSNENVKKNINNKKYIGTDVSSNQKNFTHSNNVVFSNNFYYNKNDEKTEEEKEKIKQEISMLQTQVNILILCKNFFIYSKKNNF